MTVDEFWQQADEQNRRSEDPVDDEALGAAILGALRDQKTMTRGDVQTCLSRARGYQERSGAEKVGDAQEGFGVDPEIELIADQVYDRIEDQAKELRMEIFGRSDPPFSNISEQEAWIEKQIGDGRTASQFDQERFLALVEKLRPILIELREIFRVPVPGPSIKSSILTYYSVTEEGLWVSDLPVKLSDEQLWPLSEFCESAARETGLAKEMITAFVLVGARLRPAISVQYPALSHPPRVQYAVVRIPKLVPDWEDFRKAYEMLRQMRGGRKGLDRCNKMIIEVVKRLGGIPLKGRGKFWEEVAEAVKGELLLDDFTDQAARKRYLRLPAEIRENLEATRVSHDDISIGS